MKLLKQFVEGPSAASTAGAAASPSQDLTPREEVRRARCWVNLVTGAAAEQGHGAFQGTHQERVVVGILIVGYKPHIHE